jgi:energy-coupling factor transport system ATP-binding protein
VISAARVERLVWRYSVGDWVLRDIQLQLRPGERAGLVGRSGSGKSSLALTFNGIIPQSYPGQMGGEVVVLGKAAATTPVAELAHSVAMVFQSPDDQMSQILVRHEVASGPANLGLPLPEVQRRTAEALTLLGIEHLTDRETSSLSGGEKQKVALAAALAMHPRLLVLDEPTTDLDPRSKSELVALLRSVDAEAGILIVSHDLETIAPLVDRLVIMDEGSIVAAESTADLLAHPALLERHGVAVPQLAAVNAALSALHKNWTPASTPEEMVRNVESVGLMGQPPRHTPPREPGSPVIRLENVTFRYPASSRAAVQDVSLSVARGELLAIVGNNGSGKTTLSKLILGLLKPGDGRIEVLGERVERIRPDLFGYIYQNPDAMLSQMSVRDEVAFTPKLLKRADWEERTRRSLANFELEQLAKRFPLALSKGQRQRLAYAAVTAADPPILIFDEPTTGIDQPGCDQIMHYMDALRHDQKTIVFITHDMSLAMRWADRIVVMNDGRLVHGGLPESLVELGPSRLANYHLTLPPVCEIAGLLGLPGRVATPAALLERLQMEAIV